MERAERSYRRALALEPGQPEASEMLSGLLRTRGRHEEALTILLAALERDPLSARAHLLVGSHYRFVGQLAEAGARFEAAMELDPENPRPPSALALLRAEQGRIGEAIVLQANKLPLDPLDHEGPLQVARLLLELGMTEAALPWIGAGERMAPDATTTRMFRAMWHWRRGERAEAAALAEAALDAELPARWGSKYIFESMFVTHETSAGRHERVIARVLAEFPAALDPPVPDEPMDSEAFFAKLQALPVLRRRVGNAAAMVRAEEILAELERQADRLPPEWVAQGRTVLFWVLGRPADAIAQLQLLDRGRYAVDNWFWTEVDLFFLSDPDTPAVQAYLADQEAVRERERAWLAVPGRMPDPEAVLMEMARAAGSAGAPRLAPEDDRAPHLGPR
nr:tetratricopeptide repeat protein [Thioalkalivibrio sp. XN279]